MKRETILLERWKFNLGDTAECLKKGREVTVPHTWNIEDNTEDTWGNGWYEHTLKVPESWKDKRVRVLFKAVYHDAAIYLNGKEIGRHENSGFTPFTVELTEALEYGEENKLTVKVNNEFTDTMLPCNRSFDWACDGGIIRNVELLISGKHLIKSHRVTAEPVILTKDSRQDTGYAVFGVDTKVDGAETDGLVLDWELYQSCDGQTEKLCEGSERCDKGIGRVSARILENIRYWHFDYPNLYTVKLNLRDGNVTEDSVETVFGFRNFHVQGNSFRLNGEKVRICGTEWMPGSDPFYGMAEPKEQLEKMLVCLKESNCVFTRFHWQQDDMVYDWCDRHGMLVQEEVPFWGKDPKTAGGQQWKIFKAQIEEMVEAHYNHPSIIAWGVGNELDAQAQDTIQYIKDAVAYTHSLDSSRPANYVSNSIFQDAGLDGTTDGDIMMVNDYIGTWSGELDQFKELEKILKANPDKPMVPSEFGLCEPRWKGGDERRMQIFLEKMEAYRHFPGIAGTIYFCLNDYRTQMGEDGEGKLKKRIHGSTELCGEPKPSYWAVQRECAPFIAEWEENRLMITCRKDLPCYEIKGYYGEILNEAGVVLTSVKIPDLKPGKVWKITVESGNKIAIYRPNGDRTGIY
ncbi:hypothetical protein Ana3638_01415 [Anaerocolumna sedimenticola]|uniref:Uncharacterized protein n=1 Tax=Anaerocolumna sedimenticola TaxID=2696063 RepID=A0A6P1THV8_9FIRM|nr:glycoside hydrolase family 2 TIM barrel-domain containing protein [Anaerocolumna sedimenticola]QHQ59621.1 hypothetical protein Ana3638_01415 [Anaerocolumna sedimenticola]